MKIFTNIFLCTFALMAMFFMSQFFDHDIVLASNKVNINTADITELDAIPEVGPSTATKIISYREANGLFLVIEDIMKVSGIKEATFAKMKDFITVEGETVIENDNSTSNTNDTIDNSDNTLSQDSSGSTHHEQTALSDYTEPVESFSVSAGRNRVTHIGSSVSFEAKVKNLTEQKNSNIKYKWSFGDGSVSNKEKVSHFYLYPGEYNVILNAYSSELNSVARTEVKVLVPNLMMSILNNNGIEIFNKGVNEINLYGWKIKTDDQTFVFPLDTIISAGKSVVFPFEFLKINTFGYKVYLLDSLDNVIIESGEDFVSSDIAGAISQADFEQFISEYKRLTQKKSSVTQGNPIPNLKIIPNDLLSEIDNEAESVEETVFTDEVSSIGFWSKVFHPVKTIKNAFYK